MSIIKSKDYVPYFYRNSRDYQVFLNLIDLIVNVIKINIDTIPDTLDPTKCNYLLLELLASFVGYDYDYKETYEANRLIITNYINMIRNRGNMVGIKTSAALSFNAQDDEDRVEDLKMFDVQYVQSEHKIAIYVYVPSYLQKIRDLLERTRPAGIPMEMIPAINVHTSDGIAFTDYINPELQDYDNTRREVSEKSKVGFGEVTRPGEPHK